VNIIFNRIIIYIYRNNYTFIPLKEKAQAKPLLENLINNRINENMVIWLFIKRILKNL
jgi:hypothetical protein